MAEKITIVIETGNAAFDDSPATEVGRILKDLADKFQYSGVVIGTLRDINGNRVGTVNIEQVPE